MKFSLLLMILASKLKKAVKKHPQFRERVKEKNFLMVVKTRDGKKVRHFNFKDGDITSQRNDPGNAGISLVWDNAQLAYAAMSSRKNDLTMKALSEGKLKIEGDASLALWFGETVKQMMKLK